MSNSNIPRKGDIIINPYTQHPVKVGGRTWLKLVKEGLVSGHYTDPKKLATISNDPQKQIEEINKTLPRDKQAVRGRGRYKGQIITRNKNPDTEDVSRYTAQVASRIVRNNIDVLAESEDIETELEQLILQEMTKGIDRKKKQKSQTVEKYVLEEIPQYEEEEEEVEDHSFFGDEDMDD